MQSSVQRTTTTTRRSVEGGDEISSSYIPKSALKSVIVQRTGPGSRTSRSSMYGAGSSYSSGRMSASFNPAIYSQMAGTGIADFRDTREKEKREMQDCNERLATYIEKVRWLEAKNKQLEAENDALRKRKQEDWRPIRDMYESELNQAREVIKELSTHKGVNDAKLAGLQDEIEALKDLISQYETNAKDYANKIDRLNSQIGEYEGELNSLRLRCGSLEDEIAKLRALIIKYKDENARLRADLDAETAAHIQQEVLAQTLQEENDFLNELLEKLQLTQQEPVHVKGMDMESFFKGELRKAIQDMSQMYDDKLDQMTMECESKVQHQMNQLKSGNVRDTMESEHAKSEVKRLRDQLSEKNARIAQLETELAQMRADRDNKAGELNELRMEFERMQVDYERKIGDYQMQVEALMQQLQTLMDAKMSMELEIACYKKLLEGEENRTGLRQLVEQTIGVRGGGASQLAEIIGGGGGGGGSSSSSMMTTSMRMQKTRTGNLGIKEFDRSGGFISLELDLTARQSSDMRGYRMVRRGANGVEKTLVDFSKWQQECGPLKPGSTLTLYATGRKQKVSDPKTEIICTGFSAFDNSPGEYVLLDSSNTELAALKMMLGF